MHGLYLDAFFGDQYTPHEDEGKATGCEKQQDIGQM